MKQVRPLNSESNYCALIQLSERSKQKQKCRGAERKWKSNGAARKSRDEKNGLKAARKANNESATRC